MCITEYNEAKTLAAERIEGIEEGRKEGRDEGRKVEIIDMTLKKYRRGHSVEETADILEKEPEEIAGIYDAIKACGAASTPDVIMNWIYKSKEQTSA